MLDLIAFIRHITAILDDGEWKSDWLSHLPPALAATAEVWGHALSRLIGS